MGLKVGSVQSESTVIKANSKFIAVPWGSAGCVGIVPTSQKGAIATEFPVIYHEENTVNDFEFHPFDDSLLVTATNNGAAAFWSIPEGGLTKDLTNPISTIEASDKRLLTLGFHPLAADTMVTVDAGKKVKIFDVSAQAERLCLPDVHKALLNNFCWNKTGDLLATEAKDKTLRIFDPRANACVAETIDHDGAKGGRVLWLTEKNLIFTVGFSKGTDRQIALYDPRNLATKLTLQKIDTASSTLLPFADQDNGIVFLGGKGDGNIRYYEVVDEAPYIHYLNEFKSKEPQSGLAALPRRCVDVKKCEILRLYKLTPNGCVIHIGFEVPRKENMFFQEDLYPPCHDGQASMSADDWFGGANTPANVVSMESKE
eukprot:TRINITY_DN5211_c0_g1_i3.p1 TRINITY_DN5211_c0_g1~~TRINITY_DN5211_c0_g1_i3.p1  ORF type:complete len:371 (-),score=111.83 TRINITY_DN5211_c0_g1_i3:9-1121(-)